MPFWQVPIQIVLLPSKNNIHLDNMTKEEFPFSQKSLF